MDDGIRKSFIPILVILILLSVVALGYTLFSKDGGSTIAVTAEGTAEWFYKDTHGEDHGLDIAKFGTPDAPKGLDKIPLTNRVESEDGTFYAGLVNGRVFSLDRADVSGSIHLKATDLTPVDTLESWDSAEMEAEFLGPNGEPFRVVLTKLTLPDFFKQTFGGVAFNHLIHGETDLGIDTVFPEFAYHVVQGYADVYRENQLIAEDMYVYIASSRRARVLNQDKISGNYNPEEPLGKLIVHLVVLPFNDKMQFSPIPTGVIDPQGNEQAFFHINYYENIVVKGNRFENGN